MRGVLLGGEVSHLSWHNSAYSCRDVDGRKCPETLPVAYSAIFSHRSSVLAGVESTTWRPQLDFRNVP